ncbi:MAG: proton-conducting membrane transporter [Lachnospiraceae bacterium]|nr:proton-conducting membrane transporter [Lachnospiraceae bacterium]
MLYLFSLMPVVLAILLYIIPYVRVIKSMALFCQLGLTASSVYIFFLSKSEEIVTNIGDYESVLGITLRSDTLSSVFVALTSFLFLVVVIYGFNDNYGRFYWFFMFIWQGLLNGLFLSSDLFNMFVFIEVATIIVSVLMMYKRDNRSMYDGMVYLMINTVAVQFYLFGIGYIYKLTGVLDIDAAMKIMKQMDPATFYLPFALIMTAISLKCALVPLFGWLPKAHGTASAPTAVSALLSGLHIKCAIYLFIRFQIFFEMIDLSVFFIAIGIITGFVGFIMALSQSDIKLILAYHTISQIGIIMLALNIPDAYSRTGGVYHIINHAMFKSALFLCAGIINEVYGTRDIYQIRGVLKRLPLVGGATIMAILGITGAPLFNGSISKYFIVSGAGAFVSAMIILINLGTIISFIKYSTILFGGKKQSINREEIDVFRQMAVLILGIICFFGGIFGEQFIHFLFNIDVGVDAAGYFEKILLFAISVAVGYVVFRYYVKKSLILKKIGSFSQNFRGMCASLGVFFVLVLIALRVLL